MTDGCSLDFETRSQVDLLKRGHAIYFEHPSTDALMASYRINGGPVGRWRLGQPIPADLLGYVKAGGRIYAWNASFERWCWNKIMVPRHGWPPLPLRQFVCTMSTARALGLPGSLDLIAPALGLPVAKDKAGKKLIKMFSLPREDGTFRDPSGPEFEAFHDYCDQDVLTEDAARERMISLSDAELEVYWLSEIINDRGIGIDRASIHQAQKIIDAVRSTADPEMQRITSGAVETCGQVGKLVEWITSQGVPLDSAGRADLDDLLLRDDLPDAVREAAALRLVVSKSSVGKLETMLARTSVDGRSRHCFVYHSAGTGRFSATGWQAHNLPRPRSVFAKADLDVDVAMDVLRLGEADALPFLYGPVLGKPLHLIADLLRSFVTAAPGHELMVADYSGIEGAVGAWFCREHWKIDAMRELLAPGGDRLPDLYIRAAGGIFGVPASSIGKKDDRRQIGKVAELSCFTAGTKVLTHRGVCNIEAVSADDLLWDGVEWVAHQGVIEKSARPVVDADGIGVTPDHLFLAGQAWLPASQLVSCADAMSRALATGSEALRSLAPNTVQAADWLPSRCAATAGQRAKAHSAISSPDDRLAARRAESKPLQPSESGISDTTTSWPTTHTATGCSAASPQRSTAAPTRTTAPTAITAGAAYVFSGVQTDERFLRTWSRFRDGMRQAWNWIASTLTEDTSRAISVSSPSSRTSRTGEPSAACNANSMRHVPVFDILNAGPRNRFVIFSRSGAFLVHNCQYQGGVSAFYAMSRSYSLDLNKAYTSVWAAASDDRREKAAEKYEESKKKGHAATKQLSREAWLAAEIVKVGWRATHPAIAESWKLLQDACFAAVEQPGEKFTVLGATFLVAHGFLWLRLPSGRVLAYGAPSVREVVVPWADMTVPAPKRERAPAVTVLGTEKGRLARYPLYGGLLLENIVQAVARDILVHGMANVEHAGYPVVMHVHDEVISEVPIGAGSDDDYTRLLLDLPPALADIPLGLGKVERMRRYRKA